MAQYGIKDITNVYWAANDGFKSGRDPMGIQNSSISTYACLLPGMTNLTGHIRYYSLFCWLINEYDRLEKEMKVNVHQYNFIRRAELIIAFIMRGQNVQAVIGHNFVRDKSESINKDCIYDIAKGADYNNDNKYWAYKSGAFGQYYLGSLMHYSLVKIDKERFYLRNKGKELAKTIDKSVGNIVLDLFLDCIIKGRITEAEIEKLQPIGLHAIVEQSSEWKMLNDFLISQDEGGSSLRKETVYLLLSDFKEGIKLQDFVEHRFFSVKNECKCRTAAFGWYFYYLCEKFHYCIETIFCFILNEIDEHRDLLLDILINDAVGRLISHIVKIRFYDNVDEWKQYCTRPIAEQFSEIKYAVESQEYAVAASKAIELCLRLYNELKDNEVEVNEFEQCYDLYSQRGILREGLQDYVGRYLSYTPEAYIRVLMHQVMNEHTFVAISKMGCSNVDLRKFIIENGCAVLVEKRFPNQTNPRIGSLCNFLVDLGYLSDDGKLTDIAYQYLNNYA